MPCNVCLVISCCCKQAEEMWMWLTLPDWLSVLASGHKHAFLVIYRCRVVSHKASGWGRQREWAKQQYLIQVWQIFCRKSIQTAPSNLLDPPSSFTVVNCNLWAQRFHVNKAQRRRNNDNFSLFYTPIHLAASAFSGQQRKYVIASSLGNMSWNSCEFPIKTIPNPACIFQSCEITKYLIVHMILPALFFPLSRSLLCPIFSVKQLFTQTAALAIHCSWEAIKKSSQCCVLVDALLFQHVISFLVHPPFSFMYTHIHKPALF